MRDREKSLKVESSEFKEVTIYVETTASRAYVVQVVKTIIITQMFCNLVPEKNQKSGAFLFGVNLINTADDKDGSIKIT